MDHDQEGQLAAAALVDIVDRESPRTTKTLSEDVTGLLDECFAKARRCKNFQKSYLQAIRAAVKGKSIPILRFLLDKAEAIEFVRNNTSILQFTICQKQYADTPVDQLVNMVRLLTDHGADVNGSDKKGSTPLYFACSLGLPQVFQFLIDRGADYTTRHMLPDRVNSADAMVSNVGAEDEPANLLRIIFYAAGDSITSGNSTSLDFDRWFSMILFFIEAGFDGQIEDDAYANLLEAACYEGQVQAVENLITYRFRPESNVAVLLGPGLRQATCQGHTEIVTMLLRYGADPGAACNTITEQHLNREQHRNMKQRRTRHQNLNREKHRKRHVMFAAKTAVAAACDESELTSPEVIEACMVLYKAGVSESDQEILLAYAAQQGRLDVVKALWTGNVRSTYGPLTASLSVLKYLYANKIALDWPELQKIAIEVCDVKVMDWLVEHGGRHLHTRDDFGSSLHVLFHNFYPPGRRNPYQIAAIPQQGKAAMVRYLLLEYAPPEKADISIHVEVHRQLLEYSFDDPDDLESILQIGKTAGCPELREATLALLKKKAVPESLEHRMPTVRLIRSLQTLSQYHTSSNESQECQVDNRLRSLWMTPTLLDSIIGDEVTTTTIQSVHTLPPLSPRTPRVFDGRSKMELTLRVNLPDDISADPELLRQSDRVEIASLRKLRGALYGNDTFGVDDATASVQRLNATATSGLIFDAEVDTLANSFHYDNLRDLYSTRLLTLKPSQDPKAPIECDIFVTNLSQAVEYEALSYVWGPPAPSCIIYVNGQTMQIRANLAAALFRLRSPKEPKVMWVDAICINQHDISERNRQVRIMRYIYQAAKQVLIWTGETSDNSELIFEHFRRWKQDCADYEAGRLKLGFIEHERKIINPPSFSGKTAEAFEKFCSRPWFYRIWVIQEVSLSRQAIIVCGKYREEWSAFFRPAGFTMGPVYSVLDGVHASQRAVSLNTSGSPNMTILEASILSQATEPRDKVYGLLGVMNRLSVPVDYSLAIEDVYSAFAQAIIESDNNIRMLHCFSTQRAIFTLPSWVPDFSAPTYVGWLPNYKGRTRPVNQVSKALEKLGDRVNFDKSTMRIRGKRIDQIHEMGDVLKAVQSNTPGSTGFITVMRNWESCASRVRQQNVLSKPVPILFFRTLVARSEYVEPFEYETHEIDLYDPGEIEIAWYKKFGSGLLQSNFPQFWQDANTLFQWLEKKPDDEERAKANYESFTRDMLSYCYGRSFFTTESGTMGLGVERALPGDQVVYIVSGHYPFILRPHPDGSYTMIGDCYIEGFNEFDFSIEEIQNFKEFSIK